MNVHHTSLETIIKSTNEFVSNFKENLENVRKHRFISRMQTVYTAHVVP